MSEYPPSPPPSHRGTAPGARRTATMSDFTNGGGNWGHQHGGYGGGASRPAYGSQGPPRPQAVFIHNQHLGPGLLHENYHTGEPTGKIVHRNPQEPPTSILIGQQDQGHGFNVWGNEQAEPRSTAVPLEHLMANGYWAHNVRERPIHTDDKHLGDDTVLGATFSNGAIQERISGKWEGNILKADGAVVLGTSNRYTGR